MASGNGITNIDIEKFFDDETNEDLKRNFMGFLLIRFNNKICKLLRHNQRKKSKIFIRDFQNRQRK